MKRINTYILFFMMALSNVFMGKAESNQKELAIAQMNSCVNTLTNIINSQSMAVLDHESDQLLNNLTMEHIVGLPEIAEFRVDLIDAIGSLGITEEERSVLRRINSIKADNLKWKALSGALNNTMLLTGGGNNAAQLGFQALLTAARTGIEYKVSKNEMQMEEMQAMWDLRKNDLNTFVKLRKEALDIIFRLYQKYNLKESDRLIEQSSKQFQKIISEPDAKRMIRLLSDNASKFAHLADYHYYMGMGYLDCKNFKKASECFAKYTEIYNKAPIYRQNEKEGMISLAKLTYDKGLSKEEIERHISKVRSNLPNNAMAAILCATIADKILKNPAKSLSILRSALDNESLDDKTAVMLASSLILPKINNKTTGYKDFISAYVNQKSYDVDAALNMWIAKKDNVFAKLKSIFKISDLSRHPLMIGDAEVNDKMTISFPSKYTLDLDQVKMYVEQHRDKEVWLYPYALTEKDALSLKKIEKVGAFKKYPNLKYLYMDACGKNTFRIKSGINYNAIQQETYPRQSEFNLDEKDIKSILKFLKENAPEKTRTKILAAKSDKQLSQVKQNGTLYNIPSNYKSRVKEISNLATQNGRTYVKFDFNDSRKIQICYAFDSKREILIPCYIQYQGKRYYANSNMQKEFGSGKPASKSKPKQTGNNSKNAKNVNAKTSKAASSKDVKKGTPANTSVNKTPQKKTTATTNKTPQKKAASSEQKTTSTKTTQTKKQVTSKSNKAPSANKNAAVKKKEETTTDKAMRKVHEAGEKVRDTQKKLWNKITGSDDKKEDKKSSAGSNASKKSTGVKKQTTSKNDSKKTDKKDANKKDEKEKSWWKVW